MKPRAAEQDGFTILGLLVLVAVINIGLGVAATSWVTINRRADEAELIWRGQQYVRALACHRQQTGGLPQELNELLESDCIRALYPDPISNDGEWRVLRENDPEFRRDLDDARNVGRGGGGAAGVPAGRADSGARRGARGGSGARRGRGSGGGLQSAAIDESMQRFRELRDQLSDRFSSGNRIVGVRPAATGEALRVYKDKSTYEEWLFVVDQLGIQ